MALPSTGLAERKITVVRDLDGDGHYNKKTYKVKDYDRHRHHGHYGHGYYGRGYSYRPYYYRPYSYGYPYRSYYSYPSTSVGISFSRPSYSYSRPVYEGRTVARSYSDDLAEDVQSALRRRGYYRGPIDGDIGPGTRSAIRAYQSDRGLVVTGRIDSALLRSLGIS